MDDLKRDEFVEQLQTMLERALSDAEATIESLHEQRRCEVEAVKNSTLGSKKG